MIVVVGNYLSKSYWVVNCYLYFLGISLFMKYFKNIFNFMYLIVNKMVVMKVLVRKDE